MGSDSEAAMRLEDSIFSGITKTLGAVPGADEDLRRRRVPRQHVDREISIKMFGVANAPSRTVTLVNISQQGLCIIARLAISSGDQFIASLPLPGGTSINVLCIARQSRLTSNGAFRVGAEFTSELERSGIQARSVVGMISAKDAALKCTESGGGDHQQSALLRRRSDKSGEKPVKVKVRKFAKGLFDLISPEPIAPGEQIILEFQFQQGLQAWKCTAVQTRAEIGGQYGVMVRNDGAATVRWREGGLLGWLKRLIG